MPSSDFIPAPYNPCPCGSGKKFKFCCGVRAERKDLIGTINYYGPDRKTIGKIVAGVVEEKEGAEPILQKWIGEGVADDPKVKEEIKLFFAKYKPKRISVWDRIQACIHEEGIDYPVGEDCPHCPFWVGKQGTARRLPSKGI